MVYMGDLCVMFQNALLMRPKRCRPISKNKDWEEEPQDGEAFDYNAVPNQFYVNIESIGNLEPDAVVQQAIKVLQQKLAAVLQELVGGDNAGEDGANGFGAADGVDGMQTGAYEPEGYTTPYVNPGATSAWGGGGATAYGGAATPYGVAGWNQQ